MTQARQPPESRARDRLGRLRPPPAPPLGPREPVIRLSTERVRAGRPGNCWFPLTRGACGRPESGGQERPVASSRVITTLTVLREKEPWRRRTHSAGGTAGRCNVGREGGVWSQRGHRTEPESSGGLGHFFPFLGAAPTFRRGTGRGASSP